MFEFRVAGLRGLGLPTVSLRARPNLKLPPHTPTHAHTRPYLQSVAVAGIRDSCKWRAGYPRQQQRDVEDRPHLQTSSRRRVGWSGCVPRAECLVCPCACTRTRTHQAHNHASTPECVRLCVRKRGTDFTYCRKVSRHSQHHICTHPRLTTPQNCSPVSTSSWHGAPHAVFTASGRPQAAAAAAATAAVADMELLLLLLLLPLALMRCWGTKTA